MAFGNLRHSDWLRIGRIVITNFIGPTLLTTYFAPWFTSSRPLSEAPKSLVIDCIGRLFDDVLRSIDTCLPIAHSAGTYLLGRENLTDNFGRVLRTHCIVGIDWMQPTSCKQASPATRNPQSHSEEKNCVTGQDLCGYESQNAKTLLARLVLF